MAKKKLSVIVLARNVGPLLADCLKSVDWADEVVVAYSESTDNTLAVAKKFKVKIVDFTTPKPQFSAWRNKALSAAKGDWVFYLDADERCTPELKEELLATMANYQKGQPAAYALPRQNYYLGKKVRYGGSWPDYVKRFFKKSHHSGWQGRLHEEPIFKGELGHLKQPMEHRTHRDLTSMVAKTNQWSEVEAELMLQAGHPPMVWWRFLRIMVSEFWLRVVKLQGWRDGTVGWIEALFQVFSRFISYAKLWEKQQAKKK